MVAKAKAATVKPAVDENQFGFTWGPAIVTRVTDDPKTGKVFVEIGGVKEAVLVCVTKSGLVRVGDVEKRK